MNKAVNSDPLVLEIFGSVPYKHKCQTVGDEFATKIYCVVLLAVIILVKLELIL